MEPDHHKCFYCTMCMNRVCLCCRGACLIKAVIAFLTSSYKGSEHRAHSNKRCMVFSTLPHNAQRVLACSSALVVLWCLFWLVHICLFMTRKLFVIVLDGMLSFNKFLYPCINLWRAGTGIPSPSWWSRRGDLGPLFPAPPWMISYAGY